MTADPLLDPQTREAIDAVKRPVIVIACFATGRRAPRCRKLTTSVVSLVTAMAPDFAQEPGRKTFAALEALSLA
jgi:hypothetical protein